MIFLEPFIASSDRFVESVRMYVMNPFSYSFWAVLIVWRAELLSFLDASCCSVLVVKGGFGLEVLGFSLIDETIQVPFPNSFNNSSACDSDSKSESLFFNLPVIESKSLLLAILLLFSLTRVASKVILF